MKKSRLQDERAILQKRKIGSDTCVLLMAVLLVSTLVQQYILDAPFAQYATEFFCFFGACVYIVVRNLIAGNSLYEEGCSGKKMTVISSIVAGLTVCVIIGITNYVKYGDKFTGGTLLLTLAVTFVCGAAGMFAASSILYFLNRKRQEKIAGELDEQERDLE